MSKLDKLAKSLGDHVYDNGTRSKRPRKPSQDKDIEWNLKRTTFLKEFEFGVEKEEWDKFYSNSELSDKAFYGLSNTESAYLLFTILKKASFNLKSNDIIVEVGHGKFPLVKYFRIFQKSNNLYIGIELSLTSINEIIENGSIGNLSNIQFVIPSDIGYYNDEGLFDGKVVYSTLGRECLIKRNGARLLFGRCVLDYVTSRLVTSVYSVTWDNDPRLPASVIDMFNSFVNTLTEFKETDGMIPMIFIEPYDDVKVRDHLLILFKLICITTFVNKSESQYLKLYNITTSVKSGIICYMLIKTDNAAESFDEVRASFSKIAKKVFKFDKSRDPDWLLPMKMPKNWESEEHGDADLLTGFNI